MMHVVVNCQNDQLADFTQRAGTSKQAENSHPHRLSRTVAAGHQKCARGQFSLDLCPEFLMKEFRKFDHEILTVQFVS
jgi:hypothetical protein